MTFDVDIAICGAGPVGMALAVLLVENGAAPHRIALVDAKPVDEVATDPRSIALSYGSRQILEQAGAWSGSSNPIRQIHVSRRGHFGRTLIDCEEFGLPALGYVARYGALVATLSAAVESAGILSLRPARVTAREESALAVSLQLADGRLISTRIMVQAEGGLFDEQATRSLHRDYQQTAAIAQVSASAPIAHRAFERFTDEGPLALLPQGEGYALVWCMRPARAARIAALPDSAFLSELQQAFGTRLGRFTGVSRRAAYPLGLNASAAMSARTIAIGNAAQTLHPVAGQGLNLGMRDATVLAQLLARDAVPAILERYALMRQADRSATIQLTDVLARIFAGTSEQALSQTMLGLSLGLLDVLNPAKRLLAEQMMFGRR
jgi:2-octaprenyl-6-methoxyphenol hydroxylase